MRNRNVIFLLLAICGFSLASCTYDLFEEIPVEEPTGPISFSEQVEPIFSDASCTSCHPPMEGLDLTTGNAYASIKSKSGALDLANPENSTIYSAALPGSGHSQEYNNQQAVIILNWIKEGALDN